MVATCPGLASRLVIANSNGLMLPVTMFRLHPRGGEPY